MEKYEVGKGRKKSRRAVGYSFRYLEWSGALTFMKR